MSLPKRRKAPKANIRPEPQIRCPGHLQYVRGFRCALDGKSRVLDEGSNGILVQPHICSGKMHAHHCREGANGSMGKKPDDSTAVPLCEVAHAEIHNVGWRTFEARYGVDLSALAADIWRTSSHGIKWRATHG